MLLVDEKEVYTGTDVLHLQSSMCYIHIMQYVHPSIHPSIHPFSTVEALPGQPRDILPPECPWFSPGAAYRSGPASPGRRLGGILTRCLNRGVAPSSPRWTRAEPHQCKHRTYPTVNLPLYCPLIRDQGT